MSAPLEVRRMGGCMFAVFQGDRQVSSPSTSKDMAEEKLDARERWARLRARPCLCCKRPFQSEGPHNRMCTRCRNRRDQVFEGAV